MQSAIPFTPVPTPIALILSDAERVCVEELRDQALLRNVSLENVRGLLEHCRVRRLRAAQALITPGECERTLYLVLSGELSVHVDTPDAEPVASLGPGESVGELALIDRRPRSAYVLAAIESRVLEVPEAVFWSLVNGSHEVALNLLSALARRLRGNNESLLESRRLQREYRRHALVDGLTGLYNRRWLDDVLPRQLRRSEHDGTPLSVVMIDVDHFKQVNDRYGHAAGDFVLFAVGQVLRQRFRPTDLVTRYGGEEFSVILPATGAAGAHAAADRVRLAVAETALETPDGCCMRPVTVSLGLAERRAGDTPQSLLARADQALYAAKRGGRNRVQSAEADLR